MAVLGTGSVPTSPTTIGLRPLTGGMATEGHSSTLPPGSFRKVQGFDVTLRGPKRIGGWDRMTQDPVDLFFTDGTEKIQDFGVLLTTSGLPKATVVTNRMLYQFDNSTGFVPVPWGNSVLSTATFTMASYTAGTDDAFTFTGDIETANKVKVGDWIKVLVSTVPEYLKIKTISFATPTTTITMDGAYSGTPDSLVLSVYKAFQTPEGSITDFAIGRNTMYLVDGTTLWVFKYNGTYLTFVEMVDPDTSAVTMYTAKTVAYFRERLYFGQTIETGSTVRQRVRWTEVLTWNQVGIDSYVDLDYRAGDIQKVFGADTLLLVFTRDTVYYGQQSNLVGLPQAFFQLQTGQVSAVSPKAIGTLLGGCVFVGPDDVYFIVMTDAGPTINRIGTNVANTMLRSQSEPITLEKTVVRVNPRESNVLVATGQTNLTKFWIWNYKTKGWSVVRADLAQDGYSLVSLASANYTDQLTLDELAALESSATFDGTTYGLWSMDSFIAAISGVDIFGFTTDGYFYRYVPTASQNSLGTGSKPIHAELTTQDFDFDRPDDIKTFTELTVRLDDDFEVSLTPRSAVITMVVTGSTDYGRTWKSLGTLTFGTTDVEDKLNFRLTGTTARFKMVSSTVVEPYTILEIGLRVKTRTDREAQRGTARS